MAIITFWFKLAMRIRNKKQFNFQLDAMASHSADTASQIKLNFSNAIQHNHNNARYFSTTLLFLPVSFIHCLQMQSICSAGEQKRVRSTDEHKPTTWP